MPIIYSIVSRATVVLAEYTSAKGNFDQVTRRILEKIPTTHDSKMSYVYDRHIFHYIVFDGLIFLCMADQDFGRRIPFSFLEDLKNRFKSTYGERGRLAAAYSMNEDFSRVMKNLMDYYSLDPSADKISNVKEEIDEVKTVMQTNIERVLERGEKIELLVDKTENLQSNAFKFKKSSTQLKRAMWFKNVKLMAVLICLVVLIIYVIVAIACGGPALPSCVKKS